MTPTAAVATPDELDALLALREVVFVHEQAVPPALERDGLDASATHFIARDPLGAVIGAARMRVVDGKAKAERVAVRADVRGRGVGAALMRALEAEALRCGLRQVVLNAQESAIPFYEGLGYVAEGPTFDDAGIPHRHMRRALPSP
jgi:predicted GNAT family N-acyltransferase